MCAQLIKKEKKSNVLLIQMQPIQSMNTTLLVCAGVCFF